MTDSASSEPPSPVRPKSLLEAIGPGILVAATGVGAGDLAGGALAGSRLKLAVLWVVLLGAGLKFVLSEGLARWQLQTGTSLAQGTLRQAPGFVRWLFLAYVAAWSFCIGGMLMSACGECAQAILPLGNASKGRIVHGILHSLLAIVLVQLGGFRLFEKLMAVCIGVMFFTVLTVATLSGPDWNAVFQGLLIPSIPGSNKGITWTMTLMAGVGGTLTMLCYGTWIREKGRTSTESLKLCRIDLGAGYLMTAVFGISMVILGSRLNVDTDLKGANLITDLARDMETQLGSIGFAAGWMFRIGAWGAVFSSLFGVWQSVPSLIQEMLPETETAKRRFSYKRLLWLLGIVPMFCLPFSLATVQKVAGVTGALFIPMFALALLLLPRSPVGKAVGFRNKMPTVIALLICLGVFGYLATGKLMSVSTPQATPPTKINPQP